MEIGASLPSSLGKIGKYRIAIYAGIFSLSLALMPFVHSPAMQLALALLAVAFAGAIMNKGNPAVAIALVTFAAMALKLYLVGKNEIITEPNDQTVYLTTASQWWHINGASPGYPIWLWFVKLFGVPQRIAMECLLAASSALVAWGIGKRHFGFWGYCLVFICALFSPVTFSLFDRALSDGFYMCLCLILLGSSLTALHARSCAVRVLSLACMGFAMGWMQITRKETPILIGVLLVWLLAGLFESRKGEGFKLRLARMVKYCVGVGCLALLIITGMLYIHFRNDGVWALSTPEMPQYTRMLKNLSSIKVDKHYKYFPVTMEAITQASANSLEFRKMKPFIDDPNLVLHKASQDSYGMPGELAAGWMWWIGSLAGNFIPWTPRDLEAYYGKVNRELEAAFSDGRLKRQFILHAFIGGAPGLALEALPSGIAKAFSKSWLPDIRPHEWSTLISSFDEICLRRTALTMHKNIEGPAVGWAFSSVSKIKNVQIEEVPPAGSPRAVAVYSLAVQMRPDVTTAFKKENKKAPEDCGFNSSVSLPEGTQTQVRFVLENGQSAVVDGASIQSGAVKSMKIASGTVEIIYVFDVWPTLPTAKALPKRFVAQDSFAAWYSRPIVRFSAYLFAVLGLVLGLLYRKRNETSRFLFSAMIMLIGFCILRTGFYGAMDAVGFPVDRRYVSAASLVACVAGVLGFVALLNINRLRSLDND